MSASRIRLLAAAAVASLLTPAAPCWAQAYGAKSVVDDNDLRWFEPVDFDLDGSATRTRKGWVARVDKLFLSISGERASLGDPDVVNLSEAVYRPNSDAATQAAATDLALQLGYDPGDPRETTILNQITQLTGATFTGNTFPVVVTPGDGMTPPVIFEAPEITPGSGFPPPAPIVVENGIQDSIPDADFGGGERYEIGYTNGERGWRIGILDGPDLENSRVYGAGPGSEYRSQSTDGFADFHPFFGNTPVDADGDGILDGQDINGTLFALGFGSVAVNFEAPEDFFVGFRDYLVNAFPVGVAFGPINNVINNGGGDDAPLTDDGDGATIDGDLGIVDDLNGDGATFFVIRADDDGDGVVDDDDPIIGTYMDYGDLYEFDVFFEDVTVRNRTKVDGIELMATHMIDTRHKMERGRRDELELSYGIRYLEFNDLFSWDGRGSIFGRTGATVEIDNQMIGPQVGLSWTRDHGAWDFIVDGRVMFAYNRTDRGLDGIFGQGAVPGAVNRSILARTTTTVIGDTQDEFSPLAELRIEARYKLTKALALNVGFNGYYIDNVERAVTAMRYTAPSFSLQDGKSDVFMMGVTTGIELRY